jgi:hypothetical protein
VHCVFYFIAPHRIKEIDRQFISKLMGLAPIVLVVAKADTMTWQERKDHLLAVREMIQELEAKFKSAIAFDFQEEGPGFLDDEEVQAQEQEQEQVQQQEQVQEQEQVQQEDQAQNLETTQFDAMAESTFILASSTISQGGPMPFSYLPEHLDLSHSLLEDEEFTPSPHILDESMQSNQSQSSTSDARSTSAPVALVQSHLATSHAPRPVEAVVHQPLPKIKNAFAVVCDTSTRRSASTPGVAWTSTARSTRTSPDCSVSCSSQGTSPACAS